MSRFSKAEAEAAGWTFVSDQRAEATVRTPTGGNQQVNEFGESTGLLLERIALYTAQLEANGGKIISVSQEHDPVSNAVRFPVATDATVRIGTNADGSPNLVSEEVYAGRKQTDAITTEEGTFEYVNTSQEVDDFSAARAAAKHNTEAQSSGSPNSVYPPAGPVIADEGETLEKRSREDGAGEDGEVGVKPLAEAEKGEVVPEEALNPEQKQDPLDPGVPPVEPQEGQAPPGEAPPEQPAVTEGVQAINTPTLGGKVRDLLAGKPDAPAPPE